MKFIDSERANHSIVSLCRHLGVSTSGFYAWEKRKPSARAIEDARLVAEILAIHRQKKGRYGSPRMHAELVARGFNVCRGTIVRLMRQNGIRANRKRPFRMMTTDSTHGLRVANNLLERNFVAAKSDETWVGDITYIKTDEGWLYVAVLLDLFSRRVVGHACSSSLASTVAERALQKAIERRSPSPGLIHHTDRGFQYACATYQRLLNAHGFIPSMSRKGNCIDNAVAESFFSSLKAELVVGACFATRDAATRAVTHYIDRFYNHDRLHSTLGYVSPQRFEQLAAVA
jgi:transposase InsO family protein